MILEDLGAPRLGVGCLEIEELPLDDVAQAIMDAARCGTEGDGIVAISPVDQIYRIRSGEAATPEDI